MEASPGSGRDSSPFYWLRHSLSKIVSGIPGSPAGTLLRYTRSTRYDDQRPASRPRAATHICAQCYRGLRGSLKLPILPHICDIDDSNRLGASSACHIFHTRIAVSHHEPRTDRTLQPAPPGGQGETRAGTRGIGVEDPRNRAISRRITRKAAATPTTTMLPRFRSMGRAFHRSAP